MKRKPHTWGSIFRNALRRGEDHGYAAFLADSWEKRHFAGATHQLQSGPSSIHGDYMLTEKSAKKLTGEEPRSGYQDAKDFIKALPMSWRPALLIYMAECAYEQKVFVPGGASRIIAKWEQSQDVVEP